MNFLTHASRIVNRWTETALGALGMSMALIVAMQVFSRYVLNHSLFWSEELARILLIYLTFLGASAAYFRGVHPGVDVVTSRLGREHKKLARVIVRIICLLFFAAMIYYGCTFAYFARVQISPALAIPKWIIYAAIPLSGALLFLHGFALLAADLCKRKRHDG